MWGLRSHGHEALNIFHLVRVSASLKQFRKPCIQYFYLGTSGGARAGSRGSSVAGGPRRVLLCYKVTAKCIAEGQPDSCRSDWALGQDA